MYSIIDVHVAILNINDTASAIVFGSVAKNRLFFVHMQQPARSDKCYFIFHLFPGILALRDYIKNSC